MQLSSTLFDEIIGAALNVPEGTPVSLAEQDERRRSPRATVAMRARVYPLMESTVDHGQTVLVRDLSRHGVGMLIAEAVSVGDEFVLHLPAGKRSDADETRDTVIQIQCSVRRCEAGGSGQTQFQVGATYELVLNRSLSDSVQLPDENQSAGEANEPSEQSVWDAPPPPSPFEQKFDEQLAEAVQSLPPRQSVSEQLAGYWIARLIGRLFMLIVSPIRRALVSLGVLDDVNSDASKIRSRLNAKRRKRRRKLSDLTDAVDHFQTDEPDAVAATAQPAMSFAERSLADALDSAGQLINADPENLPTLVKPPVTIGLERRHSIFATQSTDGTTLPARSDESADVPSIASDMPIDSTPIVSIAQPLFELPAELPPQPQPVPAITELPPAEPSAPVSERNNPLQYVLDSIDPAMAVPREPSEKSLKRKAAWRARHRILPETLIQNRKKLGR